MSADIARQLDRLVRANERSADNLEKTNALVGIAFDSLLITLDAATETALIFGTPWLTAKPKAHLEAVVGHAVERGELRSDGELIVSGA